MDVDAAVVGMEGLEGIGDEYGTESLLRFRLGLAGASCEVKVSPRVLRRPEDRCISLSEGTVHPRSSALLYFPRSATLIARRRFRVGSERSYRL